MKRDNQLKNTRFNKNWQVVVREAPARPYLVIIGEFAYKPNVVDYPIHYNDNRAVPIAYDYPERIPQFVKNKVAALYERFPVLKCHHPQVSR